MYSENKLFKYIYICVVRFRPERGFAKRNYSSIYFKVRYQTLALCFVQECQCRQITIFPGYIYLVIHRVQLNFQSNNSSMDGASAVKFFTQAQGPKRKTLVTAEEYFFSPKCTDIFQSKCFIFVTRGLPKNLGRGLVPLKVEQSHLQAR